MDSVVLKGSPSVGDALSTVIADGTAQAAADALDDEENPTA
jgi:hypothetical protein